VDVRVNLIPGPGGWHTAHVWNIRRHGRTTRSDSRAVLHIPPTELPGDLPSVFREIARQLTLPILERPQRPLAEPGTGAPGGGGGRNPQP